MRELCFAENSIKIELLEDCPVKNSKIQKELHACNNWMDLEINIMSHASVPLIASYMYNQFSEGLMFKRLSVWMF